MKTIADETWICMIKSIYRFFLPILILIIPACATEYRILSSQPVLLSQSGGVYSNVSKDTVDYKPKTLWAILDPHNEMITDSIYVTLEVPDKKSLKIIFNRGNKKIGEKLLHGKMKKDKRFYTKKDITLVPFFPLIYIYENNHLRIYAIHDALVVEDTHYRAGFAVIMGAETTKNDLYFFSQQKR